MGNKLVRRRQVVDDKYTKPQGLYQHRDVDHKKLRKLILDSKLAPCYPGDEDSTHDLEECPICFLHYPSLNRSRCCTKGICTECFLQMKPPHSTRPTQCPFCKTSNYAVEYRGVRSKEEKGMEQIEEQRVIEAQIRMQQQELQDEEERMQVRQGNSSSSQIMIPGEVGYRDISSDSQAVPSFTFPEEGNEIMNTQVLCPPTSVRQPSRFRLNREDQYDQDLEDVMVMEAIWLSIQENGAQSHLPLGCATPFAAGDCYASPATVSLAEASSPSSALACVVERPHLDGDSLGNAETASTFDMLVEPSRISIGGEEEQECYNPEQWVAVSPNSGRGWVIDHGSQISEVASNNANSDAAVNTFGGPHDCIRDQFHPNMIGSVLPESFEEQMMLATAVSLAESQAKPNPPGVTWL